MIYRLTVYTIRWTGHGHGRGTAEADFALACNSISNDITAETCSASLVTGMLTHNITQRFLFKMVVERASVEVSA